MLPMLADAVAGPAMPLLDAYCAWNLCLCPKTFTCPRSCTSIEFGLVSTRARIIISLIIILDLVIQDLGRASATTPVGPGAGGRATEPLWSDQMVSGELVTVRVSTS